jgi:hypothetical protein
MNWATAAWVQQFSGCAPVALSINPMTVRAALEERQTLVPFPKFQVCEVVVFGTDFFSGGGSRTNRAGQPLDVVSLNENGPCARAASFWDYQYLIRVGNFTRKPCLGRTSAQYCGNQ